MNTIFKIIQIFFISCTLLLLPKVTIAQEVNWVKETWGDEVSFGTPKGSLSVDRYGNCYITGSYGKVNTFDGISLVSTDKRSVYIAKYNSRGDIIWASASTPPIDTPFDVQGNGVCHDRFANVYIAGYFENYISFDNIRLNAEGYYDIYIAKYDPTGKALWAKQIGSRESDFCFKIQTDDIGNCYISGNFNFPLIVGDTSINGINYNDNVQFFLAKFDPDGGLSWIKTGRGSSIPDIVVTKSGELFALGEFQHYLKWENDSIRTKGYTDQYVIKLKENGNLDWLTTVGSPDYDNVYDFAVDSVNNLFLLGQLSHDVFIGDTLIKVNGYSHFMAKLNHQGKLSWFTSFIGDTSTYKTNKIVLDYWGNLYAFGEEIEKVDSSPYYRTYGLLRHKFNTNTGKIEQIYLYKDIPEPDNIGVDRLGNFYLFGYFANGTQFENTIIHSSTGYHARFLARLGNFTIQDPHLLVSIYPNPTNSLLNIEFKPDFFMPTSCLIYDLQGRLVLNQQLNNYYSRINISDLNNGFYNIVLLDKLKKSTYKILKY